MSFRLLWPVTERYQQPFTQHFMQNPQNYKQFGLPAHEGVDFGIPIGTNVYACADGVVVLVKDSGDKAYGKHVKIAHHHDDGIFETIYGHLDQPTVEEGDRVLAGEPIGKSGNTGNSTGPHLHLTLKLKGATQRGFTQYRTTLRSLDDENDLTYPRDVIDPTPYLSPQPQYIPVRPLHPYHPSLTLQPLTKTRLIHETMQVEVVVDRLNVRQAPNSHQQPVSQLQRGDQLTISTRGYGNAQIWYHQIKKPDTLKDRWVAMNYGGEVYLRQINAVETISIDIDSLSSPREAIPATAFVEAVDDGSSLVRVSNTGGVGLNIRVEPNTQAPIVDTIPENSFLWLRLDRVLTDGITWRQIDNPPEFSGNWAAENENDTQYLVPVETGDIREPVELPARPQPPPVPVGEIPTSLGERITLRQNNGRTVLAIDGDTSPQMGVNVRKFAYFGTSVAPHLELHQQNFFCDEANRFGIRWLRFYAADSEHNPGQIINKTRQALDTLAAHNMLGVVVISDAIGETGLYPLGDDTFHTEAGHMRHLNSQYWHTQHYENAYIPLLRELVNNFRNHPGLGMWQLMNEPGIYPNTPSYNDAQVFRRFVHRASSLIQSIDGNHPISIGLINTAHVLPSGYSAQEFYASLPNIHVVSCHVYQKDKNAITSLWPPHEGGAVIDAQAAHATNKAYILTEFGSHNDGNRVESTRYFFHRQFNELDASIAMQWAFMPTHNDTGVGDHDSGWGRPYTTNGKQHNREFEPLGALYQQVPNAY